jgi:hypothetical protein
MANTGSRGGASQHNGVSWHSGKKKWGVAFSREGRTHFVDDLADETEAALGYNQAVLPLAGEFARLNDLTAGGIKKGTQMRPKGHQLSEFIESVDDVSPCTVADLAA